MLMFSKVSLKSFVYDIIDVFCFLDLKVKEICHKYGIIKCFLYLNLTDTGSCSFTYAFVCSAEKYSIQNPLLEI